MCFVLRCSKTCEETTTDSDLYWQPQELCRRPGLKNCSHLTSRKISSNGWTDLVNGAAPLSASLVNGSSDPTTDRCKLCTYGSSDCDLNASRGHTNGASSNGVSCASDCNTTSECHSNKNCVGVRRCRGDEFHRRTETGERNQGNTVETSTGCVGDSQGEDRERGIQG